MSQLGWDLPVKGQRQLTGLALLSLIFTARVRTYDGRLCFHRCVSVQGGGPRSQIFGGGGSQVSDFWRGGPRSQIFRGGLRSQIFGGGPRSQIFRGDPRSQIFGGGPRSQIFWGGYPVSVKGKIFDTRFGLIHVQTGEKIFCRGTPPPVKGIIFDTRFGLIHVQTGKKNFCQGTPPPE